MREGITDVLAIDPGDKESGWCLWEIGRGLVQFGKMENKKLLDFIITELESSGPYIHSKKDTALVVEMVASYGMPVGREVFETVLWAGRFIGAWGLRCMVPPLLAYRKDIKLHHCNSPRANDSTIRQALMDKYGGKGTKANPGPFYGVSADAWSAIAIATHYVEGGVVHEVV